MTWNEILSPVLSLPKLIELKKYLHDGRKIKGIYPIGSHVFRAFDECQFEDTKVVILGQDPYPTPGTADGLAFSSQGTRPASLEIIFKEIYRDLNIQYYHNETFDEFFPTSDLSGWAKNGFLLLNTCLTVEEGKPGSHKGMGWELVARAAIEALGRKDHQVLFLLWGKEAKEYKQYINIEKDVFLEAPHPAAELHDPTKHKFSGCRHFSIVRDILPTLHSKTAFRSVMLDGCFDKEQAKKIVREHFPIESEKICRYIDKDMIISVPVNREQYFLELRNIEAGFSTKPK